jgi:hypothetical protein
LLLTKRPLKNQENLVEMGCDGPSPCAAIQAFCW